MSEWDMYYLDEAAEFTLQEYEYLATKYVRRHSMRNSNNPPYITTNGINGVWYAVKMEWDSTTQSYLIEEGRRRKNKTDAILAAMEWAKEEGLELR